MTLHRPCTVPVPHRYLMARAESAAVFISDVQHYGFVMPRWPEFLVPIGLPGARPRMNITSGLWAREFSNGTVAVNAQASVQANLWLPPGRCYSDTAGRLVTGSVHLAPLTAAILTQLAC